MDIDMGLIKLRTSIYVLQYFDFYYFYFNIYYTHYTVTQIRFKKL